MRAKRRHARFDAHPDGTCECCGLVGLVVVIDPPPHPLGRKHNSRTLAVCNGCLERASARIRSEQAMTREREARDRQLHLPYRPAR